MPWMDEDNIIIKNKTEPAGPTTLTATEQSNNTTVSLDELFQLTNPQKRNS
jgi:hypothetical protein